MDRHVSEKLYWNFIFPKLSSQNMRVFDLATILGPSFQGVRKEHLAQWPSFCDTKTTKQSGGTFRKIGRGCAARFLKPLILFQTKICDFPYPISDLIKSLIPNFRPEAEPGAWPERVTCCYGTYTVVRVNIKWEMVLSPDDEEVANSSKNQKYTQFKTREHWPYPILGFGRLCWHNFKHNSAKRALF